MTREVYTYMYVSTTMPQCPATSLRHQRLLMVSFHLLPVIFNPCFPFSVFLDYCFLLVVCCLSLSFRPSYTVHGTPWFVEAIVA
jgi:hypothetical protein